jgi:hypothetical protein
MIDNFLTTIKKGKINNELIVNSGYLKSQITCIEYLDIFQHISFGTKHGEFLTYDVLKREAYMTVNFENEKIIQVSILPPEIKDAKKHIIYVLTDKNLYCCKKQRNCMDLKKSLESNPDKFSKSTTQENHNNSTFELNDLIPISETS